MATKKAGAPPPAAGLKSKFASVNLNTLHKPVATPATAGAKPAPKGMVVLSLPTKERKNASHKSMAPPMPVQLKSLKAENQGLDPSVSLVPTGGLGWGKKADMPVPAKAGSVPEPKAGGSASSNATPKGTAKPKADSEAVRKIDVDIEAKEVSTTVKASAPPPWTGFKAPKGDSASSRKKDSSKEFPTLQDAGDNESPREQPAPAQSRVQLRKGKSWADEDGSDEERPRPVNSEPGRREKEKNEREREDSGDDRGKDKERRSGNASKDKEDVAPEDIQRFMKEAAARRAAERKREEENVIAQQKARAQEKLRMLDERAAKKKETDEACRPPPAAPVPEDPARHVAQAAVAPKHAAPAPAQTAAAVEDPRSSWEARADAEETAEKTARSAGRPAEVDRPGMKRLDAKPTRNLEPKSGSTPAPADKPEKPPEKKGWQTSAVKTSNEKLAGSPDWPAPGEEPEIKPAKTLSAASKSIFEDSEPAFADGYGAREETDNRKGKDNGGKGKDGKDGKGKEGRKGKEGNGKGKEGKEGKGKEGKEGKGKEGKDGKVKEGHEGKGKDGKEGKGKDEKRREGKKGKEGSTKGKEGNGKGKKGKNAEGEEGGPASDDVGVVEPANDDDAAIEVPKWQDRPQKPTRGDFDSDWRSGIGRPTETAATATGDKWYLETIEAWDEEEEWDEKRGKSKGKGKKSKHEKGKAKGKSAEDPSEDVPEKDTDIQDEQADGKEKSVNKGQGKKSKGKAGSWEVSGADELQAQDESKGKGKGKKGKKGNNEQRWVVKDAHESWQESGWEPSSWQGYGDWKSGPRQGGSYEKPVRGKAQRSADASAEWKEPATKQEEACEDSSAAIPPPPALAAAAAEQPDRWEKRGRRTAEGASTQEPGHQRARQHPEPPPQAAAKASLRTEPKEADARIVSMLHPVGDGHLEIGAGVVRVQGEDLGSDEDPDEFMTVKSKKQTKADKLDRKRQEEEEAKKEAKREKKRRGREAAEEAVRLRSAAANAPDGALLQSSEGLQDATAEDQNLDAALLNSSSASAGNAAEPLRGEASEHSNESAGGASGSGSPAPVPVLPSSGFPTFGPFGSIGSGAAFGSGSGAPFGPISSQPSKEIAAIWERPTAAPSFPPPQPPFSVGLPNQPAVSSGTGFKRPLRPIGDPPPYLPPRATRPRPLVRRLPLHDPLVGAQGRPDSQVAYAQVQPHRDSRGLHAAAAATEASFASFSSSSSTRRPPTSASAPKDAPPPPPPATLPEPAPDAKSRGRGRGRGGDARWTAVGEAPVSGHGDNATAPAVALSRAEAFKAAFEDDAPEKRSFYHNGEKGGKGRGRGKGDAEFGKGRGRGKGEAETGKGRGRGGVQPKSYYTASNGEYGGGRAAAYESYGYYEDSSAYDSKANGDAPKGRGRGRGKAVDTSTSADYPESRRGGRGRGAKGEVSARDRVDKNSSVSAPVSAAAEPAARTKGRGKAAAEPEAAQAKGRGRGKGRGAVEATLSENPRAARSERDSPHGKGAARSGVKLTYKPKVKEDS